MGFTNDYSKAQEPLGLKAEGYYECIIAKAEEKLTKSEPTKTYLNFSLVIRNDVDQKYKNGYIFHSMWKRKEPNASDQQVKGYSFGQIMTIAKAVGLPDGKNYADLAELLNDLKDKPLLVHLKHREYNGAMQEEINYFAPTKAPQVHHIMKKKVDIQPDTYAAPQTPYAAQAVQTTQISNLTDEDLPF